VVYMHGNGVLNLSCIMVVQLIKGMGTGLLT